MEQKLVSKGFRLLTLGLSLTLLFTLLTIAYSACEDIAYVLEEFGVGEGMP